MTTTKLTQAQKDTFPHYVEKWTAIGLSTDPINREAHDRAVAAVYALANLGTPRMIYVNSPLAGATLAAEMVDGKGSPPSTNWLWGNQWAGYAAWAEFFVEQCGVEVNTDCIDMMREGHYIWPLTTVCIASERPVAIHLDDQGRSHCETGPSVVYPDGWGPYCWHGVNVPSEWILNRSSLTAAVALKQDNMERRRAACEIVGWATILKELNARTIDKHPNPMAGELLEVDIPDVGKERFLQAMCGTGRVFAMPVPPESKTVEECQRWLNFVPNDMDFLPEIRT